MRNHPRTSWILLPLLAALLATPACQRNGWSTSSAEARAELERCLDARMKIYHGEAVEHCERALELDPDFTAAKLQLLLSLGPAGPSERRKALVNELEQADLERLTPRERFLVRYHLARIHDKAEETSRILTDYLERHPDDPFALDLHCMQAWDRTDWEEAERCYQKILEVEPNWVQAQNRLGYLAMALGQFDAAEDRFAAYRFIAPDQANPHDSMGELYLLTGRYEEAIEEFEQALAVRPDFCASYEHLVYTLLVARRFEEATEVVERIRAEGGCPASTIEAMSCKVSVWREFAAERWETAWQITQEACSGLEGDRLVLAHTAAVASGRLDEAYRLEAELAERMEEQRPKSVYRTRANAQLLHMQGTRLLRGEEAVEEAVGKFEKADALIRYWDDSGIGIFKLFNRLTLARALERSGRSEEAEQVRKEIRSVNPRILEEFGPGATDGGPE